MNATKISKMSKRERLRIMESIWDSLIHEENEVESPDWHEEVLKERKRKIDRGKAQFFSIDDAKKKHDR